MSISKSISAPTGAGIVAFVSNLAKKEAKGRQVMIITPMLEMQPQWKERLPDAEMSTPQRFITKRQDRPGMLIICAEASHPSFDRVMSTLRESVNEVWLINRALTSIAGAQH